MITKYERLTKKQKQVLDLYVECRSLSAVSKSMGEPPQAIYRVYDSPNFQKALQEFNEGLKNKILYNEAVIIDKLWQEYSIADSSKDRINILAMLGKHIGMFATNPRDVSKPNVQYNIVNYNNISEEIDKNKDEVKKEIERMDSEDIPEGVEVTNYSETLQ